MLHGAGSAGLADYEREALTALEELAEALAGEQEGSVQVVARALANRLAAAGAVAGADDGDEHAEIGATLCWYFGVSDWGGVPEIPVQSSRVQT